MSAIVLGKKARLELGPTVGGKVDFTGILEGTDSISQTVARQTRPIPGGRGTAAAQLSGFGNASFTLTCDSNSVHDPVLRGRNIGRMYFTFEPEGKGQGNVSYSGQGVARISLIATLPDDTFRWQVQLVVDGDIDASTQA